MPRRHLRTQAFHEPNEFAGWLDRLDARFETGDLVRSVAVWPVGIDDAIGESAAQQGAVVDSVAAEPAPPEAATER
jgi:hypothetical protein